MKKIALIGITILLFSASVVLAQTGHSGKMMGNEQKGMMMGGNGKGMMMGGNMMNSPMMSRMPMSGMMGIRVIATSDGGVVVMVADKLYKYDKKLDLVKEVEVPIDLEHMKNMMMNMQKMGMMGSGMMGGMKGSESPESQK